MVHWSQFVRQAAPRFCKYDLGSKCEGPLGQPQPCNVRAYGTAEPPEYDLASIRTPLALFFGEFAWGPLSVVESGRPEKESEALLYEAGNGSARWLQARSKCFCKS